MTEHVHLWMVSRRDKAFGQLILGLGETLVNASDHNIQLGQQIVFKIKGAIREDIHLRSGQKTKVYILLGELFIQSTNGLYLIEEAWRFESIGLEGGC